MNTRDAKKALALAGAALVSTLFGGAGALAGGPDPGLSGLVSVEEGWTDNVRGDPVLKEEAWFTGFEGEGTWQRKPRGWLPHRLEGLVRGRVYGEYSSRNYAEFGPAIGWDWKHLALTFEYRYTPNRLRVDDDAAVDAYADDHDLIAEFRSKFGEGKRWTTLLTFASGWEDYERDFRERTYFEEAIEAEVRYRANDWVTPRAGFTYSIRDAFGENYDRDQFGLLIGVDVHPWRQLRLVLRYEKLWRDYSVGKGADQPGQSSSNRGRDDDVDAVEAGADVPLPWVTGTHMEARCRYRDNVSSRDVRSYDQTEATLRLVYEFD